MKVSSSQTLLSAPVFDNNLVRVRFSGKTQQESYKVLSVHWWSKNPSSHWSNCLFKHSCIRQFCTGTLILELWLQIDQNVPMGELLDRWSITITSCWDCCLLNLLICIFCSKNPHQRKIHRQILGQKWSMWLENGFMVTECQLQSCDATYNYNFV